MNPHAPAATAPTVNPLRMQALRRMPSTYWAVLGFASLLAVKDLSDVKFDTSKKFRLDVLTH